MYCVTVMRSSTFRLGSTTTISYLRRKLVSNQLTFHEMEKMSNWMLKVYIWSLISLATTTSVVWLVKSLIYTFICPYKHVWPCMSVQLLRYFSTYNYAMYIVQTIRSQVKHTEINGDNKVRLFFKCSHV